MMDTTPSNGNPFALHEGETICGCRVERLLGRGGMGEVWLLKSRARGLVAGKVLDAVSAMDPKMRKRFLREGSLVLGVKHPNLVETYEVGEDRERSICYILMEYVPGGTLADRVAARGSLPIGEALALVKAIAGVLVLAKEKSIVHRDIKPENIMFGADGTPKLADLGIARNTSAVSTTTVTQTGMMIGTPAYMAPEQMVNAHTVDGRADIYSLGVVLYEMLAGERPNKEDTAVQLMAKALKGEPLPDIRKTRAGVPASVAQLISMMTAKNVANRLASPARVIELVGEIEGGATFLRIAPVTERARAAIPPRLQQGAPSHPSMPPAPKAQENGSAPRRGRGLLLFTLLLIAAGLGALAFLRFRRGDDAKADVLSVRSPADVQVETGGVKLHVYTDEHRK